VTSCLTSISPQAQGFTSRNFIHAEFKSGKPDYGAAMRQLELRLKALSFVVCCVSGLQPHQVRKIGRVFVRKSGYVTMDNKACLARDALCEHGFSLYIESV